MRAGARLWKLLSQVRTNHLECQLKPNSSNLAKGNEGGMSICLKRNLLALDQSHTEVCPRLSTFGIETVMGSVR